MPTFVPRKACNVVIGLQSGLGQDDASELIKIPLPEGCKPPNLKPNYEFFGYGGGHYGEAHYETKGVEISGSMTIPAIPGYMAPGDSNSLAKWIWGRGLAAVFHDAPYATMYVDYANGLIEKYLDCKVKSGKFKVDYGSPYVGIDIEVEGIQVPVDGTYSDPDADLFIIRPYRYSEATVGFAFGGGYVSESFSRNHELDFDNQIDPVEAVNGRVTRAALPNSDLTTWKGGFDRAFVDTQYRDAFKTGTEIGYKLTLARASVATCTIEMPRCVIEDHNLDIPAKGIIKETGLKFTALEAVDGTVRACTISEA